jgi:dihydrodipicolinate synthase/N-acetylneuraminate lyase
LGEDLGVDAAQISGPYYYDGRPDDVVAWFEEVARQSQLGFAVYNNWYTGYNMPLDLIDQLLDIPNSVGVKWASPDMGVSYGGIRRFIQRVAVVDNSLWPVLPHMLGCRAFVSHVPNFYPEHAWRVWELMEQGRYFEAQQAHDGLMVPYLDLVRQIQRATTGEGVFVRAAMEAAGRPAGRSRLPSRDDAVTPEVRDGFRALLGEFAVTGIITSGDGKAITTEEGTPRGH